MKRHHDWSARLEHFLAERREALFEWGVNDCCLFAADAILSMTGEDLGMEFIGKYADAGGAAHLLAELGGLDAIATSKLGEPSPDWRRARRGDIVLADVEGRPTLMVCDGGFAVGPGELGIVYLTIDVARQVWSI